MEQSERIRFYSVGINLLLVVIKIFLCILSGSVVLIADAIHSSTDVISSLAVFAGIKISKRTSKSFPYGLYKVENFVSLLSSIFIFLAGYEIVQMVFFETMDKVKTIMMRNTRVISINGLWGRNSGPFKFIEANIVIKADKLDKAHFVSQQIEKEIRQSLSHFDHILIHYEPQRKETSTCAVPLGKDKKIFAEHFGIAHFFLHCHQE